jgi:hypothetical protein
MDLLSVMVLVKLNDLVTDVEGVRGGGLDDGVSLTVVYWGGKSS